MRRITHEFDPVPQGFCALKNRNSEAHDRTSCAEGLHWWSRGELVERATGGKVYSLRAVQAALGTGSSGLSRVIPKHTYTEQEIGRLNVQVHIGQCW